MFNRSNGSAKPSGMEMMIGSIIKSLGVPPDALASYIEQGKQLATQFVVAMQSTDARLTRIEAELHNMREDSKQWNPKQ